MVRNRKHIDKKIGNTSSVYMKDAVRMVIKKGNSISAIFTNEEEILLKDYVVKASRIHYGFTRTQLKKLAYDFGDHNRKIIPQSWKKLTAGEDWLYGFMNRFKDLSLRRPEATSLSRATSFNKTNVADFFKNLEEILRKYNFNPNDIYNADETGCCTIQKVGNIKVIACKKNKQVGKITSAERGTLVTRLAAVNAIENAIPPFMVFPRMHFKDLMLHGAPPGTVGTAHVSGWMTAARVVMLTLPPHCSHKLQPLDKTVYGPFKAFYNHAANSFMVNNPSKHITIYDISSLVGIAFPLAFTPKNIVSGFQCTGIFPFNPMIFRDEDFLSSYVTDRPIEQLDVNFQVQNQMTPSYHNVELSTSNFKEFIIPGSSTTKLSPEEITRDVVKTVKAKTKTKTKTFRLKTETKTKTECFKTKTKIKTLKNQPKTKTKTLKVFTRPGSSMKESRHY
ncbi:uncharacterized protein LOC136085116 [Hydra vulgaris]|uniref:uncharacterized protein LOC136085116 n=1 Tax=Hydra vulgaris TaxID=6087 RepID=UPI0032EA2041